MALLFAVLQTFLELIFQKFVRKKDEEDFVRIYRLAQVAIGGLFGYQAGKDSSRQKRFVNEIKCFIQDIFRVGNLEYC